MLFYFISLFLISTYIYNRVINHEHLYQYKRLFDDKETEKDYGKYNRYNGGYDERYSMHPVIDNRTFAYIRNKTILDKIKQGRLNDPDVIDVINDIKKLDVRPFHLGFNDDFVFI
jgi:hypothetical protein